MQSQKMSFSVLSDSNQIEIPAEIRAELGWGSETELLIFVEDDAIVLKRMDSLVNPRNSKSRTKRSEMREFTQDRFEHLIVRSR